MENQQHDHIRETGLADELNQIPQYETATKTQRFINLIVDNLVMQYGLSYITSYLAVYLLNTFFLEYYQRISYDESRIDLFVIGYSIAIFNYLIYYTFCEKVFKGYTLGKLLTSTRAVREDGKELTLRNAFLRTLSRIVPFEPFSGLGHKPWHDSWTGTTVVKVRR